MNEPTHELHEAHEATETTAKQAPRFRLPNRTERRAMTAHHKALYRPRGRAARRAAGHA